MNICLLGIYFLVFCQSTVIKWITKTLVLLHVQTRRNSAIVVLVSNDSLEFLREQFNLDYNSVTLFNYLYNVNNVILINSNRERIYETLFYKHNFVNLRTYIIAFP